MYIFLYKYVKTYLSEHGALSLVHILRLKGSGASSVNIMMLISEKNIKYIKR